MGERQEGAKVELRVGQKWKYKAYPIGDCLVIDSFDHNGRVRAYWKSSPNNSYFIDAKSLVEDFKPISSLELELE
jgi:hypothetical protein